MKTTPTQHSNESRLDDTRAILDMLCGKDRTFKNHAELAKHMKVSPTSVAVWSKTGLPRKRWEALLTEFPWLSESLQSSNFEPQIDQQISFIAGDLTKLIEGVSFLLNKVSALESRLKKYIEQTAKQNLKAK